MGEIDWAVLLLFIVLLQCAQLQLFQAGGEAWAKAYQELEDISLKGPEEWTEEFLAFGISRSSPPIRIDYGAGNQTKRDAEALCIVGRKILLDEDLHKLTCD